MEILIGTVLIVVVAYLVADYYLVLRANKMKDMEFKERMAKKRKIKKAVSKCKGTGSTGKKHKKIVSKKKVMKKKKTKK